MKDVLLILAGITIIGLIVKIVIDQEENFDLQGNIYKHTRDNGTTYYNNKP